VDKFYFRKDDTIYVGVKSPEHKDEWLKTPEKLDIAFISQDADILLKNTQDPNSIPWAPINVFPIVYFPYTLTEREEILQAT
jgi:hypothetical protein